jgi:hypothetical protein
MNPLLNFSPDFLKHLLNFASVNRGSKHTGGYHASTMRKKVEKRRKRNKMARASRRMNQCRNA